VQASLNDSFSVGELNGRMLQWPRPEFFTGLNIDEWHAFHVDVMNIPRTWGRVLDNRESIKGATPDRNGFGKW
jgi:hypothetical protein